MRIKVLGSCSGTEPMPNRHHVSWILDTGNGIYWFDAGEGCSYNAHLWGIDILDIRSIFISHPHMDHVGGLPELLWTVRKLEWVKKQKKNYGYLEVFTPSLTSFEGTMAMLKNSEGNFAVNFDLRVKKVETGLILDDGIVQVEAIDNMHIGVLGLSKSYRIRHAGKTIVYSGDVRDIAEMEAWLDEGCDLMFMETGHHGVKAVCDYVAAHPKVKRLWFIHHGREILYHTQECRELACSILGEMVHISDDGDELEI